MLIEITTITTFSVSYAVVKMFISFNNDILFRSKEGTKVFAEINYLSNSTYCELFDKQIVQHKVR